MIAPSHSLNLCVFLGVRYSATGWVLDQTSIFALVDAFVQRCKDLLEVSIHTECTHPQPHTSSHTHTYNPPHSLTHSLSHSLTCSLTRSHTHSTFHQTSCPNFSVKNNTTFLHNNLKHSQYSMSVCCEVIPLLSPTPRPIYLFPSPLSELFSQSLSSCQTL